MMYSEGTKDPKRVSESTLLGVHKIFKVTLHRKPSWLSDGKPRTAR